MTNTEVEQLLDGTLQELLPAFAALSEDDKQQVRVHPVVRYIVYRLSTPAQRRKSFPMAEAYYRAPALVADLSWKFQRREASNCLMLCASA